MNLNTALKWVAYSIVASGCAIIALFPDMAKNSVIPFIITIIGQFLGLYCAAKIKDSPYIGLSLFFIVLDSSAIYIRLTH